MRTGVALLATAALVSAGCSTDESETAGESTVASTTQNVRFVSGSVTFGTPPPTATAEEPADFGISDVRLEDGRVMVTFFGDGVVNYVGHYVDEAAVMSSNDVLDVPGTSILQLDLISAPAPASGSTVRQLQSNSASTGIVSVQTAEPSDGVTQSFLGTSANRPDFTVTVQPNSPTLVIAVP